MKCSNTKSISPIAPLAIRLSWTKWRMPDTTETTETTEATVGDLMSSEAVGARIVNLVLEAIRAPIELTEVTIN